MVDEAIEWYRNVFSSLRKVMRDDADRTTGGRLFQARGEATGNDWSPKVDLLTGVCVSVCLSVSPIGYLRNHTRDLHRNFVHVAYVSGSVLLRHVEDCPHSSWLLQWYDYAQFCSLRLQFLRFFLPFNLI